MMTLEQNRKRKHSEIEKENQRCEEPDQELSWSDEEEGTIVDGIYIPPPVKHNVTTNSNRRLIIQKITNRFFKSYAEETILGPFSKCFNAIVGPNGSGKSNVIDSMLFVFGYRATKIRCKKLSVLIHNSENYPNVQSCTVGVHFCEIIDKPGDDYEIVPNSQFVVSRTASKDNSSYYELNGRKVQFKEVARLLRQHGIDLDHNRFLILQGEVEEIAMMKNKGANENETGFLEYLEDIIGTSRYKKPLEQLSDKIEVLSTVRSEKLTRLTLIEKELDALRGPMEEAMGFLKTENKIASLNNFLYQKHICDYEENFKKIEEDKARITENCNNVVESLKALSQQKSEKEKTLKEASLKYDKLARKKEEFKEDFKAAEKKDVQLQAEMVQTNTNRRKFKQQLEEEKKKLKHLETIPGENEKSIAEYLAKETELVAKKEDLETQKTKLLTTIGNETKDLVEEKEKHDVKLGQLKKTVEEARAAYDLAESALNLAQSSEETELNKLQQRREALKVCKETIKQRTEEIAQLKRKIPSTESSFRKIQSELQTLQDQEKQLSDEIRQERRKLEENKSSMQMSKSRGKILDALMQQKREGKCPGLYGRLGDLGAIDAKYDVAVSTACGPLDNIVVDTTDTALWCIDFLKKYDIGRATFIALDKQEHLRQLANTKIRTPENVHRLFDLIKVQDEKVRTAFYFGLRDTLVAEDLDQATRIAYGAQRFRVVTLKGQIIEISGTMSGGGRVSRGRMGQSVIATNFNPQEIQKMEINLEKSEGTVRELTQRQHSLENQMATLAPELHQMKLNFEKFTRELQSLKEQEPLIQHDLKKQENIAKTTKSDPKQIKALTASVQQKKARLEEVSAAAEKVQTKVDKLADEIKEKTTGKMKSVDKNINELTKTINQCKSHITKLKVAITTAERNTTKCQREIATLEQNITDCEAKLKQMQVERDRIEEDAKKLLKCLQDISNQLESEEHDFSGLKQEVSELNAEEKKFRLKQVDIEQNLKNIKEKLNECRTACHHWTAKLAKLKLHVIDNEESSLKKFTFEELNAKNFEVVELELQAAQNSIKNVKPNLNIIDEFKIGEKNYTEKAKELDEITAKRNEIKGWYDKVKNQRKDEFLVGYNIIRLKLKEMYQMITLGGDADFEIVDTCDPFADGIQLNVRPPRKSWKFISNLSGGEKTLASLALVFGLHYYRPSPLYVMDEIDAALDFKNVSIVGNYIKERTKNAQFIIISLRSNMFELCDNLVGIYKIFNCTKTITINPGGFDSKSAQSQESPNQQKEQNHENGDINTMSGSTESNENRNDVVNDSLEDVDMS